ncbi:MAG: ABC transporter substrate-binding protein [Deltaproteobacteria bacterium]|nr:ABC transporter substrate-binding protein [Deltaproteobacteria bacterium]
MGRHRIGRASGIAALIVALAGVLAGVGNAQAQASRTKVTVVQVIHAFSFAPVYVARHKGYFEAEGIDLDWQIVQGAAVAIAALSGGNAQFAAGASTEVMTMVSRGLPALAVAGIATSMTMDAVVSKRWAEARGVTPRSPLRERILALKGAKMGITSPGGAPDRYGRWLMTTVGLTPEDVQNVKAGGAPEIMAAVKHGTIEGFLLSAPSGPQVEHDGYGVILIPFRDVPEFREFVHESLHGLKPYIEAHPQITEKMARALARANNLIQDRPDEAKALLRKDFGRINPSVLSASLDSMRSAFPRDGKMTQKQWDNTVKIHLESGAIKTSLDTREGLWWTNQHLRNIPSP